MVRAYVVARVGEVRFRVQFEGCDLTWQREVGVDDVVGRVEDGESTYRAVVAPCHRTEASPKGTASPSGASYRVGDRVRVRWRGSSYTATITGILDPDRFVVHYDGHENAWDEVVPLERLEGIR